MNLQQTIDNIVANLRAGRIADCAEACREILARDPNQPEALHLLGLAKYSAGDPAAALQCIDRAIGIDPKSADYFNNRGTVLRGLNRREEAVESFRRAIGMAPGNAAMGMNLANLLYHMGRSNEAVEAYQHVLAIQANHLEALNGMSMALQRLGRFEESLEAARRAMAIQPDDVGAMDNVGIALRSLGRPYEALDLYRHAAARRPDVAALQNNLGALLKEGGDVEGAISAFTRAVLLKPDMSEAHNNLGIALKDQGRMEEAIASSERAMALKPDDREMESNRIYAMHFHPGYDAKAIQAALAEFNRRCPMPVVPHENDPSAERRLRIGYVSPDFREHVVGWNFLPLIEKHDHERFEIFCYSDVRRPDGMTERIRAAADRWRNILGKTHDEAAAMIREDGIDILVDLTLHMAHNRLMVFARKPAPIQVTYLGYCGSTGLEAVDYRFSDPYLDPPGTDHLYVEKTVRLPTSYWCYRPGGQTPDVPPLPDRITFACLNNFAKASAAAMELWEKILRAVPGSQLLMNAQPGNHLDRVRARFENSVDFVGIRRWELYIQTYHRASISLDPFPYGGGITTCDSLWMGVPVVTLTGNMPVGRAGTTLLSQIGLQELIARTPEEYVKIAVKLANDRTRLTELRQTLRDRMKASPLMDAARLARDVEAAYRQMWRDWVGNAETHYQRGLMLRRGGKPMEAIAALKESLRLAPDMPGTYYSMGLAFHTAGQLDEAIEAYSRAIQFKPDSADAHNNLGNVLLDKEQIDAAMEMFNKAIELKPDFAQAHNNLGNAYKDRGQVDRALQCLRRASELWPDAAVHSNMLLTLCYDPSQDAASILREARRWNDVNRQPIAPHENDRHETRQLRIGYVSADLRDHVGGRNLLPLLENRDREQFEVFCYSDVWRPDSVTERIRGQTDYWRSIAGKSHDEVAAMIRQDGIDILIDLALHTAQNRLPVFARKPAPIQVTWLGYPGTTGLETMDYRLTDPYLDPPGTDAFYAEKSVRLPDTFWCCEHGTTPPVDSLPARQNGYITFGCLNNFCKVNDRVLDLWRQVLEAMPKARMILRSPPGSHRGAIAERLLGRVEFVERAPRQEYLRHYHRIDIGLDTVPYNGHTTSLDSFWMGVPVITLIGDTVVGRGGWSQLSNLGLAELAARTPEEFMNAAVSLADNLDRLEKLRMGLRERMSRSPLMDGAKFARGIEAAYRQMWRTWINR